MPFLSPTGLLWNKSRIIHSQNHQLRYLQKPRMLSFRPNSNKNPEKELSFLPNSNKIPEKRLPFLQDSTKILSERFLFLGKGNKTRRKGNKILEKDNFYKGK